jgi:hypothetical protein
MPAQKCKDGGSLKRMDTSLTHILIKMLDYSQYLMDMEVSSVPNSVRSSSRHS